MATLFEAARACLAAADVDEKVGLTQHYADAFRRGELEAPDDAPAPDPIRMPGRPAKPALVHPRDLPRRGLERSIQCRAGSHHPFEIHRATRARWRWSRR